MRESSVEAPGCLTSEEVLMQLYPDAPLLCYVHQRENSQGDLVGKPENYGSRPIGRPPLLVPNPLRGQWGLTAGGKRSARALTNVGPRRFLVLDFDADAGGLNDHAAILLALARDWPQAPLRAVLFSGRVSLHGWLDVRGLSEEAVAGLTEAAATLGADGSTFGKAQLVRVPNARRPGTGLTQHLYFLNP
jgi:hypothetical protein